MAEIKLIATDLDGTLLNSSKTVSQEDRDILSRMALSGVHVVPATGRLYFAIPQEVKELSGVRYFILANGAVIYDARDNRDILRTEIPLEVALEVLDYLEPFPCICGCYMYDRSWMSRASKALIGRYIAEPCYQYSVASFREPEGDLRSFIAENRRSVQKLQLFSDDRALIERLLSAIPERFAGLSVTSALPYNIEINAEEANKGTALFKLSAHLGVDIADTLAIGDGANDLSMLERAGIGVAMGNAFSQEVKAAADYITSDCDHAGVAEAVRRFCGDLSQDDL